MPSKSFGAAGTHSWSVPDGVETVAVTLDGAGGGGGGGALEYDGPYDGGAGGDGARVTVAVDVTNIGTLDCTVGDGGGAGDGAVEGNAATGGTGRTPGPGGDGGGSTTDRPQQPGGSGGGGGYTSVAAGSGTTLAVAGGGGGGGGGTIYGGGETGHAGRAPSADSATTVGAGGDGQSGGSQTGGGGGAGVPGGGGSTSSNIGETGGGGGGSASLDTRAQLVSATAGGGASGGAGGEGTDYNQYNTRAYAGGDGASGSVTIEWALPPTVGASVVDNDQIDLSIDSHPDDAPDGFAVEINRDGEGWVSPTGGPPTPSTAGTYSYGPNSDKTYETQVGIDSSFKFRVRAEADGASSGWKYTSTVYTDPVPPRVLDVSRPDANSVEITLEKRSNDHSDFDHLFIQFREDIGSGYSGWKRIDAITNSEGSVVSGGYDTKGNTVTLRFDANTTYQYENSFGANSRVQFRIESRQRTPNQPGYSRDSEWIYHDYGNQGNVYFADDFSSGDKSAWDSSNGGNVVSSGGHADTGVGGPITGGHYFQGFGSGSTSSTFLQKNLGDLSSETNVHVQCRFAVGSLDRYAENFGIDWYDGSSWRELTYKNWEYNEQGWFEIHEAVPDSWLASDNRIRVGTTTSSGMFRGDYFAVDQVIVADILDEYTKPAAPTNVSASTGSGRHEIDVSWTDNLVDLPETFREIRTRVAGTANTFEKIGEPSTISAETVTPNEGVNATVPRRDGEQYDIRVDALTRQPRHGSIESYPRSKSGTTTATTRLPAPTDLSVETVTADTAVLAWTGNHDYGSLRVDRRPTDSSTWTAAATGLDRTTESYTLSELRNGEEYDARVVATTEYSETEDQ